MGEVKKKAHSWRPFVEARAFARQLGLKSRDEWKDYSKSGKRPPDIPSNPEAVYKTEFKGFGDWLGTGAIATSRRTYRPFVEARAFVHTLGLKNMDEWRAYCKSGEKPADIPAYPGEVDAYCSEFKSWGDWLGTGTVASSKKEFRPFSEARAFVRDLGLRNQDEWVAYCRSGEKPPDIPTNPDRTYWLEFEGYGDWLGTGSVSNHDHHYRLFAEARAFVHTLKLKAYDEWRAYCKSGKKPADIPSQPKQVCMK